MRGILDAGNTRIKTAVFDNKSLVKHHIFNGFSNQITDFFVYNQVQSISIGAVIEIPDYFLNNSKFKINWLKSDIKLPIRNEYANAQQLGIDRIANAIAAWQLNNKSSSVLAIDMGTCIKFDFVNENGVYMGGSISPGMQMRFKALGHFTQKLPVLDFQGIAPLIGNGSVQSIQSGVINGCLAEVDGIIDRCLQQYPSLKVFLTGGDASFFNDHLKNKIFTDPFLTLYGLNLIALENGF